MLKKLLPGYVQRCDTRSYLSMRCESQCSTEWFMGSHTYRVWPTVQRWMYWGWLILSSVFEGVKCKMHDMMEVGKCVSIPHYVFSYSACGFCLWIIDNLAKGILIKHNITISFSTTVFLHDLLSCLRLVVHMVIRTVADNKLIWQRFSPFTEFRLPPL